MPKVHVEILFLPLMGGSPWSSIEMVGHFVGSVKNKTEISLLDLSHQDPEKRYQLRDFWCPVGFQVIYILFSASRHKKDNVPKIEMPSLNMLYSYIYFETL